MMSRVKQLQNELIVAHAQIKGLTIENQVLKMTERRQVNALSKYEGTHAKSTQMIRSYSENKRWLQNRLRWTNKFLRKLEDNYRTQTAELHAAQKRHKHLLDLTKNEELGGKEKLSKHLEEAVNMIKLQEKKNQMLLKKINLQDKNYQKQINVTIRKARQLREDLNDMKETNDKLKLKMEKLKYQNYASRHRYVRETKDNLGTTSKLTTPSKNSLLNDLRHNNHSDHMATLSDIPKRSLKSKLVQGKSDISDQTNVTQKKFIRRVKKDITNKPDKRIGIDSSSSDPFDTKSSLDHGISESIQIEPIVAGNSLTLSCTSKLKSTKIRKKLLIDPNNNVKALNCSNKTYVSKPQK